MPKSLIDHDITNYAFSHTQAEPILLQRLTQETYDTQSSPHMLSGRIVGRFLKILIRLSQAKQVLELGTFTGYSALSMAEGLPQDGHIITCDNDPLVLKLAKKYFDQSQYGQKIKIVLGPALDTISTLTVPLDFVFIDADKSNYLNYYQAVLPKVRSGGMIVFDNALKDGEVIDPINKAAKIIDETNKFILADKSVENTFLTVRDGLNIVRKK